MNIFTTIFSRLNKFSIIGSLIYGLLCALSSFSEAESTIGHIAHFLSAALFFFTGYVLFSVYKVNLRQNFFRKLFFFFLLVIGITQIATVISMIMNQLSYFEANDAIANTVFSFLNKLPFLP